MVRDSDDDVSSGSTANLTSTTEVRGDGHLELEINNQESGNVRIDSCVHGNPSSVDNHTESESNAENEVLDMPGSSCGYATLYCIYSQHESNSASVCPANHLLYNLLMFNFQKWCLVIGVGY